MKKLVLLLIVVAAFLGAQVTASAQAKNAKSKTAAVKSDDPAVGKTADGKTVFEGSRGGFYYLSDKNAKVYVKDFVGAKIVGKTKDGDNIYQGPKGGKFYYSAKGDKIYVKGK